MVTLRHHQAARDRSDAAFHEARVMIEDNAVDPGVAELGLRPRQTYGVVGAKQLLHVALVFDRLIPGQAACGT